MSATIPVQGGGEYVIHLNGEPMDWQGAGGLGPDGYVRGVLEPDGEPVHVQVTFDSETGGMAVTHVHDPEGGEEVTELSMVDEQPDTGSVWESDDGEIRVAVVPEGER